MVETKPRNSVPVLVAALICDVAVADPSTGKKSLIGIFDRLWANAFPTTRAMAIYWKVTDAFGKYQLVVRMIHSSTSEEIVRVEAEFTATDRLMATDFVVGLPPVPFPKPGRYEFQILADDAYLGSAIIDAAITPSST